jgi:hypothetical protein
MRMLLVLTALSPLLLASNYSLAHTNQVKVHRKVDQPDAGWTARYDRMQSLPSDAGVSNSEHQGLINGVSPGPARWPGDTQLTN